MQSSILSVACSYAASGSSPMRDIAYHADSVPHVVEYEQRVGEDERAVRHIQIVDGGVRQILEEAHHVVAYESHRAAAKPGKIGVGT